VHRYRFAVRPGWLAVHLFTVVVAVTMVLLGRWQLDVSNSKHFSLQNFGYAIQWWLFTACGVVFWGRLMRDQARAGAERGEAGEATEPAAPGQPGEPAEREEQPQAPVAYRRYVMPTVQNEPADSVHAAYNDYLAALAARDTEDARERR
jgi:DNA-binding transcriptional regulator of glucitol operon